MTGSYLQKCKFLEKVRYVCRRERFGIIKKDCESDWVLWDILWI